MLYYVSRLLTQGREYRSGKPMPKVLVHYDRSLDLFLTSILLSVEESQTPFSKGCSGNEVINVNVFEGPESINLSCSFFK